MIENITVVDKNGNSIIAEGISYINVTSNNKKYVFYTMNEIVSNNLTKIYIAEVSDGVGIAQPISDLEWDFLRKEMIKISGGEAVPEIQNIPMNGKTFYIGEPKKLALKSEVKQIFKDRQFSSTLNINQDNKEISENTQNESTPVQDSVNNAFVATSILDQPTNSNIESNIIQQENISVVNEVIDKNDSIDLITDNKIPSSQESQELIKEEITPEPTIGIDKIQPEMDLVSDITVTKEEAMQALEILNRYFKYTNELPSSLIENNRNLDVENKELAENEKVVLETAVPNEVSEKNFDSSVQNIDAASVVNPIDLIIEEPPILSEVVVPSFDNNITEQNNIPISTNSNLESNSYVASSNGPVVKFDNSSQSTINDIPVVMPDGYNEMMKMNSMAGMGPSSLQSDGVPILGINDAA